MGTTCFCGGFASDMVPVRRRESMAPGATRVGTTTTVRAGGDDTINGDATNNILLGEGGNEIINGGDGADTINGGAGEVLLVAGTTLYDNDLPALVALMTDWGRTNANSSYGQRIINLRSSGFLALVSSRPFPPGYYCGREVTQVGRLSRAVLPVDLCCRGNNPTLHLPLNLSSRPATIVTSLENRTLAVIVSNRSQDQLQIRRCTLLPERSCVLPLCVHPACSRQLELQASDLIILSAGRVAHHNLPEVCLLR